jgi:hypothetical protein
MDGFCWAGLSGRSYQGSGPVTLLCYSEVFGQWHSKNIRWWDVTDALIIQSVCSNQANAERMVLE